MKHVESIPVQLFRFLGKVQFTMALLIGGGIVLAWATYIDSTQGSEAAQQGVYHTFAFDVYLFLIVVNLVVAVINRIPIQRNQWAFVLTHSSLVLLLFGAWISRTYGWEGTLALRTGDSLKVMTLASGDLEVRFGDGELQRINVGRVPQPGLLTEAGPNSPRLSLKTYEPDAEYGVQLVAAGEEKGPGVEIHLDGHGMHKHEWLIADHHRFRSKDLGPVEVALLVARSEKTLQDWLPKLDSPEVTLRVTPKKNGPSREFLVPRDLGKEFELEGGLKISLSKFLKRARVKGKKIDEGPKSPVNPALIFTVQLGDRVETHTVFSQFPEFNVVKGREEAPLLDSVSLLSTDAGEKPLVRILVHPESNRLWVQLAAATGRGVAHPIVTDRAVVLGSLGYEIKLLKYLKHAKPEVKLAKAKKKGSGARWIQVQVGPDGDSEDLWIPYHSSNTLGVNEKTLSIAWIPAVRPLPFTIRLEEVKVEYHPGSNRARQYWSRVKIDDPSGHTRTERISMNRPLDHAGYRIFQSGFDKAEGDKPAATYLSIAYDPGVPLVYFSFFALILGIAWYVKSNPVQSGPKEDL